MSSSYAKGQLNEHEAALVAELEQLHAEHVRAAQEAVSDLDRKLADLNEQIRATNAERMDALVKVNADYKALMLDAGERHAKGGRADRIREAARREAAINAGSGMPAAMGAARCYLQSMADSDAQREYWERQPVPGRMRWF